MPLVPSGKIGRARRVDDAAGRYIHFAKSTFPQSLRLDGLRVVIDCANGAAYKVAPAALWELGADVVAIGVTPNGTNINDGVGSTAPQTLAETVVASGADIGIALDGDADRLIIVDETGAVVDGDQLMAMIATSYAAKGGWRAAAWSPPSCRNLGWSGIWPRRGWAWSAPMSATATCSKPCGRAAIMSAASSRGIIILSDYARTGDGLVAALQVLAELKRAAVRPPARCCTASTAPPSSSRMSASRAASRWSMRRCRASSPAAEAELAGRGRLVIRPSGTEPVIRVMAEGEDKRQVETLVDRICDVVREVAA